MPFSGVEPWVVLPSTTKRSHSMLFSATSIWQPPGDPQSGTIMTSSSENSPRPMRWRIPILLVVSSSAT